jgi:hypothetical protein
MLFIPDAMNNADTGASAMGVWLITSLLINIFSKIP